MSPRHHAPFAPHVRAAMRAASGYWRRLRPPLIAAAAVTLVAAMMASGAFWLRIRATNAAIGELVAGRDRPVDAGAAPELIAARIDFLTKRDEIDGARILADSLERHGKTELSARARYHLGNAQLRKAFATLEKDDTERSTPLVALAKREYRRALQRAPDFWDAKFNLDIASRLVRDFKEYERKGGDEPSADPKKLWTVIPGAPKGLP